MSYLCFGVALRFSPAVNQLQSSHTFKMRLNSRVQYHILVLLRWCFDFSRFHWFLAQFHHQNHTIKHIKELTCHRFESPQILPWRHREMPQNTSRDVLWTLKDWEELNQTQSRRSHVFIWFILESDQTWQIYLLFAVMLCSSEGPTWFRSAPFTWNDQLWCQSSPRQQGEPEADVTSLKWQKVRKTGHVVDSSQIFIQNS